MLEGLKISRGWVGTWGNGTPHFGVDRDQILETDRPCVVLWADDFERMAAVVEAAMRFVGTNDDFVGLSDAAGKLRAHLAKQESNDVQG